MKKVAKHTGLGRARIVGRYIQEEILNDYGKRINPKPKPVLGLRGRFEQDYLSKAIDLKSLSLREGKPLEVLTQEEKINIKKAIEKFVKENASFNDSKGIQSVTEWARDAIIRQKTIKEEKSK